MLKSNKKKYYRQFKVRSNKGSALIMVILIVIIVSLIGSSILVLTMNNFQMSIFYSEYNKSYFLAESGIERIAKVIDEKVTAIQENARVSSSSYLQDDIQNNPMDLRSTTNNDGSVNYDNLNNEFNKKYLEEYYNGIDLEFNDINSLAYKKVLLDTNLDDGNRAYFEFQNYGGSAYLDNVSFDSDTNIMTIEIEGIYNGYKKDLRVKLDLTALNTKDSNSSEYDVSVKEGLNKKPSISKIFYGKALVSEKNIMSIGGTLTINGDVEAFGTVPTGFDGKESLTAYWYNYGGIMAGISSEFASNGEEFGFDNTKTGTTSVGKIYIDGNAATMGYIHSLYGTNTNSGDITITKDAYARSVISEVNSNFSNFNLNNVYTLDNLQADSSMSNFDINGEYCGAVDAGYMIDGSNSNTEEKMLEDNYNYKRTSSVVINGDSKINFKSDIYIGGSSFLVDFLEDGTNYPYMTGIAALKSNRRLYNAYTKEGTTDKLYWYANGSYENPNPTAYYKKYTNNGNTYDMIKGKSSNPDYFPISNRAMHFKGIWDNIWKLDDLYLAYLNTDNITVKENGNKLNGYSNGALIANGQVYGINDFQGGHDPVVFHNKQLQVFQKYHEALGDLLIDNYNPNSPKLDYVAPSKSINTLVDARFNGVNRIETNKPYISKATPANGMLFYGKGDVEVKNIDNIWKINDSLLPSDKGIIFVDGNIYIDSGFNFTGTIIASGNIIFLGDCNVTYDQSVVVNLLNTDVNIKGFFKLLEYDIPNAPVERQRITSNSFKIIEWKEIN